MMVMMMTTIMIAMTPMMMIITIVQMLMIQVNPLQLGPSKILFRCTDSFDNNNNNNNHNNNETGEPPSVGSEQDLVPQH